MHKFNLSLSSFIFPSFAPVILPPSCVKSLLHKQKKELTTQKEEELAKQKKERAATQTKERACHTKGRKS